MKGLSGVKILGDLTKWRECTAIDNVVIRVSGQKRPIPFQHQHLVETA